MSMLLRYKKTGGFIQLLTLLETCGPVKRDQLLQIIQTEDPGWAALLKTKILTVERVFSWDPFVVTEITHDMPAHTLAIALHGLSQEACMKATHTMTHIKRRDIETLIEDARPNSGEVEAARVKIINRVRELERDGRLSLNTIDPAVSLKDLKVA